MKQVQLVTLASDWGASVRGASRGPDVLYQTLSTKQKEWLGEPLAFASQVMHPADAQALSVAKHIHTITRFLADEVVPGLERVFSTRAMTLVLSGDHSNAIGVVAAFRRAFAHKKIGIVWLDAHADIHCPHTSPSGNVHGMTLGTVVDFTPVQPRTVDAQTQQLWGRLCTLANGTLPLPDQPIVYLGLRDFEQEENDVIEGLGLPFFPCEQIGESSVENIVAQVQYALAPAEIVFVSFDVDVIDKQYIPATGTPVDNGLSVVQAGDLLAALCQWDKVAAVEITEFNPALDNENKIGLHSAHFILQCVVEALQNRYLSNLERICPSPCI